MSEDIRHIVSIAILQATPELEISQGEYASLSRARTILSAALAIEERYAILIENYMALENALLRISVANTVQNAREYEDFFVARLSLNTCIVNILTAVRLYLDQLPSSVGECLDDEAALIQRVKERCSKEYDDNVEYRFMEALRNHVQHRGIPIHLARQHARWTGTGESRLMEFSVDIFALRSEMEDDHKFKKSVLTEMSERVDLKLATRSYLDSISAIHQFARDIVAPFVTGAREAIENVHERYEEIYTEGLVGISAFTMTDGEATSSIPLLLDWDDVRVSLQNRNCKLNLRKSCVSGRPAPNSP